MTQPKRKPKVTFTRETLHKGAWPDPKREPESESEEDDEEAPEGAPKLETPEDPAEPPVFGATDATATDSAPDIVELDTGIAVAPATRISAFGPAPVSTAATDYGVATSPMVRPNVFAADTTLGESDSPSPGY